MSLVRPRCPSCKKAVPDGYWEMGETIRCPSCEDRFEWHLFPAASVKRRVAQGTAAHEGDANCYFHPTNRAEMACEGCGRYVCELCSVTLGAQKLCPSCIDNKKNNLKSSENQRVRWHYIVLVLTLGPLVLFFAWPLTLVTAPVALFVAIYGWNKPASILPVRTKLWLGIGLALAVLEIIGWCILGANLLFH